jgi:hypothetical protein
MSEMTPDQLSKVVVELDKCIALLAELQKEIDTLPAKFELELDRIYGK